MELIPGGGTSLGTLGYPTDSVVVSVTNPAPAIFAFLAQLWGDYGLAGISKEICDGTKFFFMILFAHFMVFFFFFLLVVGQHWPCCTEVSSGFLAL